MRRTSKSCFQYTSPKFLSLFFSQDSLFSLKYLLSVKCVTPLKSEAALPPPIHFSSVFLSKNSLLSALIKMWRWLAALTVAAEEVEEEEKNKEASKRLFRDEYDDGRYWRRWRTWIYSLLETNYLEIGLLLVFATLHFRRD